MGLSLGPAARADLASGGLLAAVGVVLAVASLEHGLLGPQGRLAPGLVPFIAGSLMALFGAVIAGGALRRRRLGDGDSQPERGARLPAPLSSAPAGEGADRMPAAMTVFGLLLLAVLVVPLVGFLAAFGLLAFVLLVVVEREPLWTALLLSTGGVAFAWLVFVELLSIPLPDGPFS